MKYCNCLGFYWRLIIILTSYSPYWVTHPNCSLTITWLEQHLGRQLLTQITYTQKIELITSRSVIGVQKVCKRILYFIRGICDPTVFICIEQLSQIQAKFQPHTDKMCACSPTPVVSKACQSLGAFHAPPSRHILFIPLTFFFLFLKLFFHLNLQLPIESISEKSVDETLMKNAFPIASFRCLMSMHYLWPLMFHQLLRSVQISLFPEGCFFSFFQKTPCYPECNT